jgi:hypothetical protein
MKKLLITVISAVFFSTLSISTAEEKHTPGYNTTIPEVIMTPDTVKTRIGTLKFVDGRPTPETSKLMYDNLDFMRGVEVFLNFIPATSIEGIRLGLLGIGLNEANKVAVFDDLMDSNPLFLTGNTDTVYGMAILDLKRDGAVVIEIPKGQGPATVNDAYFRFVTDMGVPGPDKGKGGKYLILPPEYEGDLNPPVGGFEAEVDGETYFVSQSTSYINWFIARGFLVDGKTDAAINAYKDGLKIYPLSRKGNPPKMEFISASSRSFNTIHANTFEFYNELHAVIDREPLSTFDPELRGLAAAIGIQKGKPFKPDVRMKEILIEAVAVGNATARSIWLKPRDPEAYLYENSSWYTAFLGGSWEWLREGGNAGRYLDARTMFFYMATVNTPAMVLKIPGKGSQYALNAKDSNGDFLEGDKTYKLNIPNNVPAKDFWSVVVYDPQTRSELQTSQPYPSKNNKRDDLDINEDGSVDLYFGPVAPKGQEKNWVQTVPGKGWFVLLRLYGPLEPWFDKTWQPGEFELIK